MKRYLKAILYAAPILMLACACEKETALEDPAVKYLLEYSLNQGGECTYTTSGDFYRYTAFMTDPTTGNVLKLVFVSSTESLQSGTYSYQTEDYARNGNFIIGTKNAKQNSSFLFGEYNKQYNVKTGEATLVNNGGQYTVQGTFGLSNGLYVKIDFSGALSFEWEEPSVEVGYDYIEVTKEISSSASDGYVTIQVGTDGITTESNPWGGVSIGGSGNYLTLVIYSANGSLAEGTYTIGTGEAPAAGQFLAGSVQEVSMFGMTFTTYAGTQWYTVADGESTAVSITSGEVVVTKSGSAYTICLNGGNDGAISVKYEGSLSL